MTYPSGDVRDQLAYLGRAVVRAGLVVGSGGNLSARVDVDTCWVTATGTWLDRLDRTAFVRVRIADGTVVGAAPVPPTSELALHLAGYRVRADARAVAHLHPQTLLLLDALGHDVRLVTTDHASYAGPVTRTPFRPPGTTALADVAAQAHKTSPCVVLAHHGCSVLGADVAEVHRRVVNLAEAAELTYRALVVGALDKLPSCPDGALHPGS